MLIKRPDAGTCGLEWHSERGLSSSLLSSPHFLFYCLIWFIPHTIQLAFCIWLFHQARGKQ